MIALGQHADFIIWAYVGVTLGTLALIGTVVVQARLVNARLKTLEAQGVRRRSGRSA